MGKECPLDGIVDTVGGSCYDGEKLICAFEIGPVRLIKGAYRSAVVLLWIGAD